MGKRLKRIVFAAAAAMTAAVGGGSYHYAHLIAKPHGKTLPEEKEWEQEHGLWGDFDSYKRTAYTVGGEGGYVLHCECVETNPGSRKYVILTHGFTSNRYGVVKYIDIYRNLGYNCVIYDVRQHGENEGSVCTLGNTEARDLLCLIDDTFRRFGGDIELGLHGESMGSSISLNVLRYKRQIHFVVADCGFANLYELIDRVFSARHLGWMTGPVNLTMRLLYHFDMHDTSARDALKDNKVPICFIHGADDRFILPQNSEELKTVTKGYAELHLVPGADHAQARETAGEEDYTKIVGNFLKKIDKTA